MPTLSNHSGAIANLEASFLYGVPAGANCSGSAATVGPVPDTFNDVHFSPLHIHTTMRVNAVSIETTTINTGAPEVTELGLYSHNYDTGFPYRLLYDFGSVPTGTPGGSAAANTILTPPFTLVPGFYWGATLCTGTGTPSIKRYILTSSATLYNRGNLGAAVMGGYILTGANLTLPPLMINAPGNTSSCPRFFLRGYSAP